jgi:uncharacterized protein (TIGR03083 family)
VALCDEIQAERATLAESLEAVGPQARTACGDWTSFDLAAHVVASERGAGVLAYCVRTLAARGVAFHPDPRLVNLAIARQRRDGYPALVSQIRQPCPRLLRSTAVAASTLFELWMHHDDLTSANGVAHGAPMHLALAIPALVRYQAKRLPKARLLVRTTDDYEWRFGPDDAPSAVLCGSAADVVRWLAGRRTGGSLSVDADDAVVADLVRAFVGRIG